jgi:hypothetical protein
MNTERFHTEGDCPDDPGRNTETPEAKEARRILMDAIAALGRDACERWVTCGWLDRREAVIRVQHGENPDQVARDYVL